MTDVSGDPGPCRDHETLWHAFTAGDIKRDHSTGRSYVSILAMNDTRTPPRGLSCDRGRLWAGAQAMIDRLANTKLTRRGAEGKPPPGPQALPSRLVGCIVSDLRQWVGVKGMQPMCPRAEAGPAARTDTSIVLQATADPQPENPAHACVWAVPTSCRTCPGGGTNWQPCDASREACSCSETKKSVRAFLVDAFSLVDPAVYVPKASPPRPDGPG